MPAKAVGNLAPMLSTILLAASLYGHPVADQTTLRYVIITNGEKRGEEVDVFDGNNVTSTYSFNDRGRGPSIKATYNGVAIAITGVDYFKAPVSEEFHRDSAQVGRWKDNSGEGSSSAAGTYLSQNGSGGIELARLIRMSTPGKALPLLPAGEARVEKIADKTLTKNGKTITVSDYEVDGLGLTPTTVWIDDQGYYFASPSKWFGTIREGWESEMDTLLVVDEAFTKGRASKLAAALAEKPRKVEFIHAQIFDSEHAVMLENQTVVVENGKIAAIYPNRPEINVKSREIDCTGMTLLPGLFDMHCHIGDTDGILDIASGVTGVRDMGNDMGTTSKLQAQWDSGEVIGPRLWKAGLIDGKGPFQAPIGTVADNLPEALDQVKNYAEHGFVQIKLYSSLKPELVKPIAEDAHRRGLRVSGHVPSGMIAQDFVEAGADEIQHINFILLNFLKKQVPDTRSMQRFVGLGDNEEAIDLNSPEVAAFVKMLADRKTAVDVTNVAFETMFTGRPKIFSPSLAEVKDRLPVQFQRALNGGGLPVKGDKDRLYSELFGKMLAMTKKMYDAGVPILVGTDGFAGLEYHRELELEVKAGIPASKALQNATWVAAGILKAQGDSGSIAVGKRADLVLVEGNPMEKISDIRRTRWVMKGGVLFDSAKLYAAMSIKPAP